MARKGRVRVKKGKAKKRGTPSYKSGAKRPRRAGQAKRLLFRINEKRDTKYLARCRGGYQIIWKKAGRYVRNLKRFPRPGTCDPANHHRGAMPSLPGDFHLTEKQAGTILEKVAEAKGTSYAQLRTVSSTLSYLYSIQTGEQGKNWESVRNQLASYDEKDFVRIRKSLKPTVIPDLPALQKAFTTGWTRDCGVSLALFCTMLLAGWCTYLWGCRSNVDMTSLKEGPEHCDNEVQGWAWTAYKDGRNKLSGRKKGTRKWKAFFVCMCPDGKHKPVPQGWEYCLDATGNPRLEVPFPSECPLNARQIKIRCSHDPTQFRLFSKWTKSTQAYVSNHGDPADLARRFLELQGAGAGDGLQYCRNAGRMAFANWLDELHVPYHEGFQAHGDLPDVWKKYQPGLQSSNFAEREQNTVPAIVCAALRRFRHSCGRDDQTPVDKGLDLNSRLMVGLLRSQGQHDLAKDIVSRYNDEQKMGDN